MDILCTHGTGKDMTIDPQIQGHISQSFFSWAHIWNLRGISFVLTYFRMIQSGHNFAQVMAAQLLWPVKGYDLFS